MNKAFCTATCENCFFNMKNKRRPIVNKAQASLTWVGINSGNVIHSTIVHCRNFWNNTAEHPTQLILHLLAYIIMIQNMVM